MLLLVDGYPATEADLDYLALVNYGAYTSFRVEAGGVRGLDLHLARLDTFSVSLFGVPVGEDRLRTVIHSALDERRDAWLRISLFSPHIAHRDATWTGVPRVMVAVSDPPPPLAATLRVQTRTYVREEPHIKHTATFGLMRARRAARAEGFDDALFVDAGGRVSEGTLWNVGFVHGDTIVWPDAPMLDGVAQTLIKQGLAKAGTPQSIRQVTMADLPTFDAAFACNSATPACPIVSIDGHTFDGAPDVLRRLEESWTTGPLQAL